MLTRIVKMEFNDSYVADFKLLFNDLKTKIIEFNGCVEVKLLQHHSNPNLFFTVSIWENAIDLDYYRNSDFFKTTWQVVKLNFCSKPEAWSLIEA